MANILITGSRAPVSLDLARKFTKFGHKVFLADSIKPNISFYSNSYVKFYLLPKPRFSFKMFTKNLEELIIKEKIDILIPTCEEIFYIAKLKFKLEKITRVFTEDINKLNLLHNKFEFVNLCFKYNLSVPKTIILNSRNKLIDKNKFILKRMYSRFATDVIIDTKKLNFRKFKLPKNNPWLKQEFIEGKQYCTYSIVQNGKLLAHSCYPCEFLVKGGACINFRNVENDKILNWIENFVKKFKFSGQISFDFIIDKENEIYAIECNPRTTSGVHLFNDEDRLDLIFLGEKNKLTLPSGKDKMISLAMLTFGFPNLFNFSLIRRWFKVFINSKDPIFSWKDIKPYFFQFYIVIFYLIKSIKNKSSVTQETTKDIEWNGK